MRHLKYLIGLLAILCCASFAFGQNVVTGKYKGHIVKMKYYKGSPDDIQYLEYGLVTELNKTITRLENEKASLQKELNKLKGKPSKTDDDIQRQLLIQERDLLANERTIDSLNSQLEAYRKSLAQRETELNDSLRILRGQLTAALTSQKQKEQKSKEPKQKVQKQKEQKPKETVTLSSGGPYFGVGYSVGMPFVFNSLLNQKTDTEQPVWNRRVTFSHQVGLYFGSRSLVKKGSLSLGIGLEYSRLKFAAGIGQLSETLPNATDSDQCNYTAHLSYRNVEESATLHYLSIPLTLSVGQPHTDRISGYLHFTLVPSFCVASSLSASGYYSHEGHYTDLYGNPVELTLADFSPLGFGHDRLIDNNGRVAELNRFLLEGRIAGGIYLPLCRVQQGETSHWAVKLGVKMDFAITTVAKGLSDDALLPDATYRLNQYNLLSGKGCRFVNPGLEVGIMYIFGTKN